MLAVLVVALAIFPGMSHASVPPLDCSMQAGSLPNPALPPGTPLSSIPIEHIVVIMQENHSFDNYFGALNQPQFYGAEVDGVTPQMTNPDANGRPVPAYHEHNLCVPDPGHSWNNQHTDWDNGLNDQFVRVNRSDDIMGWFDQTDIPFYYSIANEFAIADRYFCSVLTSTFPNRYFLLAGTAFGHIKNDLPKDQSQWSQKTIFDVLNQYGISWKYYTDDKGYLQLFGPMWRANQDKMAKTAQFAQDLAAPGLPSVMFIDASFDGQDEHPNADEQVGQMFVAGFVNQLMASQYWMKSAFLLTYDENGGFFDHVAPPQACVPDNIAPMLEHGSMQGGYDQLGFRVPFVAVSPWAKRHYVSHNVYDHTSVLKFIETKFNLPALTARDANADGLMDLFDFTHPRTDVPVLAQATIDPSRTCTRGGTIASKPTR
jgi:phospholipase C